MRLPRLYSDHSPILLDFRDFQGGRRYFKFKNNWLKSEGFVDKVKQWWISYHFQGSLGFIWARKLKALKSWNEVVFDNIERRKKLLFFWNNYEILILLKKRGPYVPRRE